MLYAAFDVIPMVPHIYELLASSIKAEFRPLLSELCRENLQAMLQPEEVKRKKKQRKLDMEVLELRQKLAAAQSKGVVLSNREIRLLRSAHVSDSIMFRFIVSFVYCILSCKCL